MIDLDDWRCDVCDEPFYGDGIVCLCRFHFRVWELLPYDIMNYDDFIEVERERVA